MIDLNGFKLPDVLAASDSVPAATVQAAPYAGRISAALDLLRRALAAMGRTPADATITSVLRSGSRNETVGGSQYSHHLSGYAVDFAVRGVSPSVVFDALKPLHSVLRWDELAVYDTHIHLSADPRARGKVLDLRTRKPAAGTPPAPSTLAGLLIVLMLGLWALLQGNGSQTWS